jgi:hypothetical protein
MESSILTLAGGGIDQLPFCGVERTNPDICRGFVRYGVTGRFKSQKC